MRNLISKSEAPGSNSEDPGDARDAIRARARAEGFAAVGFARACAPPGAANGLAAYLARGHHGGMAWMETHRGRRADPVALWPDAKSVIVLGVDYTPAEDPLAILARREEGAISVYARGADYHDVVKKQLKRLAGWIATAYGAEVKVFVDTAPVMEKPLAAQAGLGWQGKHTNLVSRDHGSWLFLGSVFTTLVLEPDAPETDHCGSCSRCLDICPTRAFPAPGQIDARRCISYLTIEHKGHIAPEFRGPIGNRIYGCDDCLAVCPWNKFAQVPQAMHYKPHHAPEDMRLEALAGLDDAAFRAFFKGSPVKRIGRDRFVRNVLIAIGNTGAPGLAGVAQARLGDSSPLVRAMAVWALGRLLPDADFAALRARHESTEADPDIRAEWASGRALPALRS